MFKLFLPCCCYSKRTENTEQQFIKNWLNKLWCTNTLEYHTAKKMRRFLCSDLKSLPKYLVKFKKGQRAVCTAIQHSCNKKKLGQYLFMYIYTHTGRVQKKLTVLVLVRCKHGTKKLWEDKDEREILLFILCYMDMSQTFESS